MSPLVLHVSSSSTVHIDITQPQRLLTKLCVSDLEQLKIFRDANRRLVLVIHHRRLGSSALCPGLPRLYRCTTFPSLFRYSDQSARLQRLSIYRVQDAFSRRRSVLRQQPKSSWLLYPAPPQQFNLLFLETIRRKPAGRLWTCH